MMRDGLRALLNSESDIEVLCTADDCLDATRLAAEVAPDIVVMDIGMHTTNCIEAIGCISRDNPAIGIIVLTALMRERFVCGSLNAGARGYVLKSGHRNELMEAISDVSSGGNYLSPDVRDLFVAGSLSIDNPQKSPCDQLTPREREVLKLVAEGYRTREIADVLSLSHKTIEKHRANFMRKLDLRNASAVTAFAISNGITST